MCEETLESEYDTDGEVVTEGEEEVSAEEDKASDGVTRVLLDSRAVSVRDVDGCGDTLEEKDDSRDAVGVTHAESVAGMLVAMGETLDCSLCDVDRHEDGVADERKDAVSQLDTVMTGEGERDMAPLGLAAMDDASGVWLDVGSPVALCDTSLLTL